MTVQELIDELNKLEDKTSQVGICYNDFSYMMYSDVAIVCDVDDSVVDTDKTIFLQLDHPNMKL